MRRATMKSRREGHHDLSTLPTRSRRSVEPRDRTRCDGPAGVARQARAEPHDPDAARAVAAQVTREQDIPSSIVTPLFNGETMRRRPRNVAADALQRLAEELRVKLACLVPEGDVPPASRDQAHRNRGRAPRRPSDVHVRSEARAKPIRMERERPPRNVYDGSAYVGDFAGSKKESIILDGSFTLADLERIVEWMKERTAAKRETR
jgi:hypothetical protein